MTPLRYATVLFDVGGTLIAPRESYGTVYARVLRDAFGLELPAADLEAGLRACWREIDRTIPRGSDRYRFYPGGEREYWLRFVEGALARTPGVPPGRRLAPDLVGPLREAFRDPTVWTVFEDVVPALAELTAMGARLGIVSNWDSRLPSLLERLDLARWFGAIAVSHHVGFEKPRPEPFLSALSKLGGPASRALHVGDTAELDEEGARAAGIDSILIDRHGAAGPNDAFGDLRSLPAIVRGGRD